MMKRPCPNCGGDMKESLVLTTTRGSANPGVIHATAEEWEQLRQLDSDSIMPEELREKYGWRKWYCERCRLTIGDEHKVVAPPSHHW